MKETISTHNVKSTCCRKRFMNLMAGMLLVLIVILIKYEPGINGYIQGMNNGLSNFLLNTGWILLLALSIIPFFNTRKRSVPTNELKIYKDGLGIVPINGDDELFVPYEDTQVQLVNHRRKEDIEIYNSQLAKKVAISPKQVADFDLLKQQLQQVTNLQHA